MADALAAWMDSMDIGRAALVGNSLGCEVLVELAVRHPDRVERLVLQGPTPDSEQASALRQVMLFCVTGLFEHWSLGGIAVVDYLRGGVWRYIQTFRHMQAYRVEEALSRIAVPVLVVRGSRDFLVPQAWANRIAHRLPAGRLVVVPGAAHGMNYSHSRELRDVILPFLLGRDDGTPVARHGGATA
jgi:pimeloyl-ACP methyl ester carboxylesterase